MPLGGVEVVGGFKSTQPDVSEKHSYLIIRVLSEIRGGNTGRDSVNSVIKTRFIILAFSALSLFSRLKPNWLCELNTSG